MRIEGHHHGRRAVLARHAPDAFEDLPVSAMHAVEIAQGQYRVFPARRAGIVRKMDDVHHARVGNTSLPEVI